MKLEPIVHSLLDTDLYKFNMDQVIFHKHTNLSGEYYFLCRNEDIVFTQEMLEEINVQIDHLCTLRFTKEELDYLRAIRFIKSDYVEFLRLWHPIRDYVETGLENGKLSIIVRGPLFSAMQFEIYLLEIVNEVYFRMAYDYDRLLVSAQERRSATGQLSPIRNSESRTILKAIFLNLNRKSPKNMPRKAGLIPQKPPNGTEPSLL